MSIRRSTAQSSFVAIVACAASALIVASGCHGGANALVNDGSAGGLADGSAGRLADGAAGSSGTGSAGVSGGTAGSGGDVLIGPLRPLPTVADIQPLDLATAFDSSKIRILASNSGDPLGPELLAKLASSFTLRTWPELSDVPFELRTADAQPGGTQFGTIALAPKAPLGARWYELVGQLPAGITWPAGGTSALVTLADGSRAARFRVDSLPLVVGMVVYAKSAGAQTVYVELSESVPATRLPAPTISYVDGAPSSCVFDRLSDSASPFALHFSCGGDLDLTRAIRLALEQDASAPAAPALEGGEAAAFTIAPADWIDQADGGMFWKRRYP